MAPWPSLCSPMTRVYVHGRIIVPLRPSLRGVASDYSHPQRLAQRNFMALDQDSLTQLLDTVERFVNERLRPMEKEVAENDRIPDHIATEMKELGLFGLSIPEEYGGLGLTVAEEIQVARRLG